MKKIIQRLNSLDLKRPIAIIGSGKTGESFFDLLKAADIPADILDEKPKTNESIINSKHISYNSNFTKDLFKKYSTILISPGVDQRRDCFDGHQNKIITDIELFSRIAKSPKIGVTGSNGKSTVCTMIDYLLSKTNKKSILCGNIGTPVLQALLDCQDIVDYYVIELSSYHLEKAPSLRLQIGVLLNISPDHLNRYNNFDEYADVKRKILTYSNLYTVFLDDPEIKKNLPNMDRKKIVGFSYYQQKKPHLFLDKNNIYIGNDKIFDTQKSKLIGKHNSENIMASICVLSHLNTNISLVAKSLQSFSGLAHRSELISIYRGVYFINDSKGTNVGATLAAINGIDHPVVLIAGGDSKQQDFTPLIPVLKKKVKKVLLYGRDKKIIYDSIHNYTNCEYCESLVDATHKAIDSAFFGDTILLSPACASFDQFKNYQERGELFKQTVLEATQYE